jgi:hypothetical protein
LNHLRVDLKAKSGIIREKCHWFIEKRKILHVAHGICGSNNITEHYKGLDAKNNVNDLISHEECSTNLAAHLGRFHGDDIKYWAELRKQSVQGSLEV